MSFFKKMPRFGLPNTSGSFSPKRNRFQAVSLARGGSTLRGHKRRYGLGKVWLKCAKVLKPKQPGDEYAACSEREASSAWGEFAPDFRNKYFADARLFPTLTAPMVVCLIRPENEHLQSAAISQSKRDSEQISTAVKHTNLV